MKSFFARLGAIAFIELTGLRLLHLQNYMQYRAIIYICMVAGAVLYIVAEACIESTRVDCITDYAISQNTPTAEDLFECLEELAEELDNRDKNE